MKSFIKNNMQKIAFIKLFYIVCISTIFISCAPKINNPLDPSSPDFLLLQFLHCALGNEFCPNANGDGNSGTLPIQPDAVANIRLWLKADTIGLGNGTPVANWADSSGNAVNAFQATGILQPLFITNALNGKPGVQFDGTNDFMAMPEFMNFSTLTFIIVAQASGTTGSNESLFTDRGGVFNETFQVLSSTAGNVGGFFRDAGGGTIGLGLGGTGVSGTTSSVLSFTISGAPVISAYYNGNAGTPQSTAYVATQWDGVQAAPNIGRTAIGNTLFLDGFIAEVIIYSTVITESERQGVECYLSNKYAIALKHNCAP